jgi:hypothetical protein
LGSGAFGLALNKSLIFIENARWALMIREVGEAAFAAPALAFLAGREFDFCAFAMLLQLDGDDRESVARLCHGRGTIVAVDRHRAHDAQRAGLDYR